jgi:methyl-CpG-binding domain protein 4
MLNMTPGTRVKTVIHQLFQAYGDPNSLLQASDEDIMQILQPLGLQVKRTEGIKRFSQEFLTLNWTYPEELHGIGRYANDCYRIFCCGETSTVLPTDHALRKYLMWRMNPFMDIDEIRQLIDSDVKNNKKSRKSIKSTHL